MCTLDLFIFSSTVFFVQEEKNYFLIKSTFVDTDSGNHICTDIEIHTYTLHTQTHIANVIHFMRRPKNCHFYNFIIVMMIKKRSDKIFCAENENILIDSTDERLGLANFRTAFTISI